MQKDKEEYLYLQQKERQKERHLWDSNPQSLPPESNALPLGQGASLWRFE
jgi:hypothetical protein